jgi:hypothetical protein
VSTKVTKKEFEKILREGIEKPHPLGEKLYLVIQGNSRHFSFRYTNNKRTRKYSLKPYHPVTNTLLDARRQAMKLNALLAEGLDPHEVRKRSLEQKAKDTALERQKSERKICTFEKLALEYISEKSPTWSNKKSHQSWTNSLTKYAFPTIGNLPVSEITKEHLLAILQPIWIPKYPTAKKVRQRIEAILSRAIYFDLRPRDSSAPGFESPGGTSCATLQRSTPLHFSPQTDGWYWSKSARIFDSKCKQDNRGEKGAMGRNKLS